MAKKQTLEAPATTGPMEEPPGPEEAVPEPSGGLFAWFSFVAGNDEPAIRKAVGSSLSSLVVSQSNLAQYKVVALLDSNGSIGAFHADRIHAALTATSDSRDVLLLLLSGGGSVEPAYQISKLCRQHAKTRFVVSVPRQAKSAATLISIGADEIHMGPLSHLGPIDPQLGGLPALGVVAALETISALAEKFPGSADMLSRYLRMALTVEQIGYCQRISESAKQYAERLLSTKTHLEGTAADIAHLLVYEYKDHGFVVDFDEAKQRLGSQWVKTGTAEAQLGEEVYRLYESAALPLSFLKKKHLAVLGDLRTGVMISDPIR